MSDKTKKIIKKYARVTKRFNQQLENYLKQKTKVPRVEHSHKKLKIIDMNKRISSLIKDIENIKKNFKMRERLLKPVLQSQRENYFGRCFSYKVIVDRIAHKV